MGAIDLANKLRQRFDGLAEPSEFRGEVTLVLNDAEQIEPVCRYARDQLKFDFLVDITSVDNDEETPRFTIVYHLYGLEHHCLLRLKTSVAEEVSELPTVSGIWRTADWHEREIYDMMGVRFRDHPDLRRIIMWEGYPFFPLRKDFPLAGKHSEIPEVAFTEPAPMEGGPFATSPGEQDSMSAEPRVKTPDEEDE